MSTATGFEGYMSKFVIQELHKVPGVWHLVAFSCKGGKYFGKNDSRIYGARLAAN